MGGSLEYEEISAATKGRKHANITNFLETGTYKCDSALMAAEHFENVYTVEIFEPLFKESVKRAKEEGVENIHFYLGDSLDKLSEMTEQVKDGAVFFLDSHVSGHDSGHAPDHPVPLLEELEVILNNKLGPSLFIIDDVRFFKDHCCVELGSYDWAHIDNIKILKMFKHNGHKVSCFYESNDRLFIFTE